MKVTIQLIKCNKAGLDSRDCLTEFAPANSLISQTNPVEQTKRFWWVTQVIVVKREKQATRGNNAHFHQRQGGIGGKGKGV